MKNLLYILTCLVILSSCGRYGEFVPAKPTNTDRQVILNAGIDEVWTKCVSYLVKRSYRIKTIDKSSGVIITEEMNYDKIKAFSETIPQYISSLDCGGIPPGTSNIISMTTPTIVMHILVEKIDNTKTKVLFIPVFSTLVTHGFEHIRGSCKLCAYPCYSKGLFEKEFFEEINK